MTELPPRSTAATVGMIILGVLFLLPGACGTLFFGGTLADWIANGFTLRRGDIDLGPAVAGLSAVSLVSSIFLFSFVVRHMRWPGAPKLSLILAIIAALVSVLAGLVLFGRMVDGTEMSILILMVLAGLLFGAGVPLQFWLKNRAGQKNQETP